MYVQILLSSHGMRKEIIKIKQMCAMKPETEFYNNVNSAVQQLEFVLILNTAEFFFSILLINFICFCIFDLRMFYPYDGGMGYDQQSSLIRGAILFLILIIISRRRQIQQ